MLVVCCLPAVRCREVSRVCVVPVVILGVVSLVAVCVSLTRVDRVPSLCSCQLSGNQITLSKKIIHMTDLGMCSCVRTDSLFICTI